MNQDFLNPVLSKGQGYFNRIRKAEKQGNSEIQRLFQGAVVFITGGTGFLGKQLLEKLLRSCPGIRKVYVLLREKKGMTVTERLEEQWKDPVYDELRKIEPEFRRRVFPIRGEVAELKLGIKDEDWNRIKHEITFVFHTAATVRFDEPLLRAILVNVRGTKEILTLASDMPNLKALVYVSSAYANCNQREVREVFYETPVRPETVLQLVETVDERRLNAMCDGLMEGWPNTYTFSKALAENLVKTSAQYLPVCVVRPCIITPTYQEPTMGWLDIRNVFGPSGVIQLYAPTSTHSDTEVKAVYDDMFRAMNNVAKNQFAIAIGDFTAKTVLGVGLGVIHTMWSKFTVKMDLVPLDFVNNLTIVSAWDTVRRRERNERDIKIYTCSRKRNPLTWNDIDNFLNTKARFMVTPMAVWYCYSFDTQYYFLHIIAAVFLHFIPALLIDGLAAATGNQPRLTKAYCTALKLNTVLSYFVLNSWTFHDDSVLELKSKMSEIDQEIYQFDVTGIDLDEYLTAWCIGLRKYIMKDGLRGTGRAIVKQKWFRIANCVVGVLYVALIWYVFRGLYDIVKMFLYILATS